MKPLTSANDGNDEFRGKQKEILKQIEKEIMNNTDRGAAKVSAAGTPEKFKNFETVTLNVNEDYDTSRCNLQNSMAWKAFNERFGLNRYCLWIIMVLIALCCIGMCLSIGGAIYIRYFRHNSSTKTIANVTSALLLSGNKRLSSAPPVQSQTSNRPEIFRVNIKINSAEDKASANYVDSLPTMSSSMDHFEETLFRQMFKDPNDGSDLETHTHSSSSIDSDFMPVNSERDLQKPPALNDLINFVKRLLNIPNMSDQDNRVV